MPIYACRVLVGISESELFAAKGSLAKAIRAKVDSPTTNFVDILSIYTSKEQFDDSRAGRDVSVRGDLGDRVGLDHEATAGG